VTEPGAGEQAADGWVRISDFEKSLGRGLVQKFEGHPAECPTLTRHVPHHFTYRYLTAADDPVIGTYWCEGAGREPFPSVDACEDEWQAQWCAIHGTCTCPHRPDGEVMHNEGDTPCPLHHEMSTHPQAGHDASDAPAG
jgi:hypothetical protein